MTFLNLIRWKNLCLIALVQILIKFALLEPFIALSNLETTLTPIGFGILVLATLSLAAAGYIINDVYDLQADTINKPASVIINNGISEKAAVKWFIALNVIGVGLGYLISYEIAKPDFFALFIIISGLLYLYSAYLKQYVLIGNLIVGLLVGLSLIIVGVYDLLPALNETNRDTQILFLELIYNYALFAFGITLIREVIKDIEDTEGDASAGYKSASTQFGIKGAKILAFVLNCLLLIGLLYYLTVNLYKNTILVLYFLGLIIAPLIFSAIKILQAKDKKDFSFISGFLKIVMLTGMCSMILIHLTTQS